MFATVLPVGHILIVVCVSVQALAITMVSASTEPATATQDTRVLTARSSHAHLSALSMALAEMEPVFAELVGLEMTAQSRLAPTDALVMVSVAILHAIVTPDSEVKTAAAYSAPMIAHLKELATTELAIAKATSEVLTAQ